MPKNPTSVIQPAELEVMCLRIAQRNFPSVQTLATQNSDGADFHDVAVWAIRSALLDAFQAGMDAYKNGQR